MEWSKCLEPKCLANCQLCLTSYLDLSFHWIFNTTNMKIKTNAVTIMTMELLIKRKRTSHCIECKAVVYREFLRRLLQRILRINKLIVDHLFVLSLWFILNQDVFLGFSCSTTDHKTRKRSVYDQFIERKPLQMTLTPFMSEQVEQLGNSNLRRCQGKLQNLVILLNKVVQCHDFV